MNAYVRWFTEIGLADIPLVGGKNASLGELVRELGAEGIAVPGGFAVTAEGYRYFLRRAGLDAVIAGHLAGLDTQDVADLRRRGALVRNAILGAELPSDLAAEITGASRNELYDAALKLKAE